MYLSGKLVSDGIAVGQVGAYHEHIISRVGAVVSTVAVGVFGARRRGPGSRNGQTRDDAVLVVDGIVREVFRSPRQDRVDYLVEIEVKRTQADRVPRTPPRVATPAPGDIVYVHASQRPASGRVKASPVRTSPRSNPASCSGRAISGACLSGRRRARRLGRGGQRLVRAHLQRARRGEPRRLAGGCPGNDAGRATSDATRTPPAGGKSALAALGLHGREHERQGPVRPARLECRARRARATVGARAWRHRDRRQRQRPGRPRPARPARPARGAQEPARARRQYGQDGARADRPGCFQWPTADDRSPALSTTRRPLRPARHESQPGPRRNFEVAGNLGGAGDGRQAHGHEGDPRRARQPGPDGGHRGRRRDRRRQRRAGHRRRSPQRGPEEERAEPDVDGARHADRP